MDKTTIRLRDNERDVTLELPPEQCVAILAAARDHTDSLEELLKDADRYHGALHHDLLKYPGDELGVNASYSAPFEVDLVANRIKFPGDVIDFARRGVLAHGRNDGSLNSELWLTYEIGRRFTLYDSDANRVVDEEMNLRNEKSLWSNALPPSLDDVEHYRLEGTDLEPEDLRNIYVWTQNRNDRPPEIDGRSVYEFRLDDRRRKTEEGRVHKEGPVDPAGNRGG